MAKVYQISKVTARTGLVEVTTVVADFFTVPDDGFFHFYRYATARLFRGELPPQRVAVFPHGADEYAVKEL